MLGRGLLGVAMAFAGYALVAAPASLRRERTDRTWVVARPELLTSARRALVAVAIATGGASVLLWVALFTRDFSIDYVAMNTSRAAQPWYTFSAFWAGMAGSLLLWSLVLSLYAAAFVARRKADREPFVPWTIPVLAGAELFYLALVFGPENPFAASDVVPLDGRGLNPLLHSPGMLIHPPLLYTGLIGLIVPFAITVAALLARRTGAEWIRLVRRWTLLPWLTLGCGLVLGGAWAYTELGWGGYWGWDPVENAALMPWLAATAFLHSAVVQERRGMLKVWNVFLVVTSATLATFGAFLTRSGLLSSVHTFAESPVGRWFFVFLAVQAVGGIGLLLWRLPQLRTENRFASAASKEAAFLINNLVFICAAAVVLWGTILPLASEAVTGEQLAVGAPFFNRVFAPIGAALLLLSSLGTVMPWRSTLSRGALVRIGRRLAWPAAIATLASLTVLVTSRRGDIAGVVWLAVLLAIVSVNEIRRARRDVGGYVVHLGVAVMVIGFAGSLGRSQAELTVRPDDTFAFAGYTFTYERLERSSAADKEINLAVLELRRGRDIVTMLRPQLNFHRNWDQPQSEIAIEPSIRGDVYVILAGIDDDSEEVIFRLHSNPLVGWVWAGALIALVGGILLMRRRPGSEPRARVDIAAPSHAEGAGARAVVEAPVAPSHSGSRGSND
jgi:cytochrome c-type biogenesis protein CcmF